MRQFVLIAICFLGTPLAAETRQHGNLIFDVPQGWETGGTDDGTLYIRSELPNDECDFCAIRVTPGTVTGGRVDTWLGQQTRRFVDPDERRSADPVRGAAFRPDGTGRFHGASF